MVPFFSGELHPRVPDSVRREQHDRGRPVRPVVPPLGRDGPGHVRPVGGRQIQDEGQRGLKSKFCSNGRMSSNVDFT